MFQPDLRSRKSIYEQIVDNLREEILSGVMKPDEKLLSVRELSRMLTVNPNTIQKAYRELERQAYVYTSPGLGTFVEKPEARKPDASLRAEAMELLRRGVTDLRYLGMSTDEIKVVIYELIERGQS
ncbi:MAG: GntR family transcriptional regulator [Clostridiales Family XIII bacterium]|jgi:GntR family transcriptional regulator|nr:GntR family transcriptional regulator [Clostridiales Family XIII bacterium]